MSRIREAAKPTRVILAHYDEMSSFSSKVGGGGESTYFNPNIIAFVAALHGIRPGDTSVLWNIHEWELSS